MRPMLRGLTMVAVLAAACAVYFTGVARKAQSAAGELRQAEDLRPKLAAMETQLAEANRRRAAADEKNGQLLQELEALRAQAASATAAKTPAAAPITHDVVETRYRAARELMQNGDHPAALRELLWCYDEGMVRVAAMSGLRTSGLLGAIKELAATYPPAREALAQRRDRLEQRLLGGDRDRMAALELGRLNNALGEDVRNLELFDRLPAGDPRKDAVFTVVHDQLLSARRYADAVSVRSYAKMLSTFELTTRERALPPNIPNADRIKESMRKSAITRAAQDVETLAGAGDAANARLLADKILAYDNTSDTRALLQQHAARAGQPDLLSAGAAP